MAPRPRTKLSRADVAAMGDAEFIERSSGIGSPYAVIVHRRGDGPIVLNMHAVSCNFLKHGPKKRYMELASMMLDNVELNVPIDMAMFFKSENVVNDAGKPFLFEEFRFNRAFGSEQNKSKAAATAKIVAAIHEYASALGLEMLKKTFEK